MGVGEAVGAVGSPLINSIAIASIVCSLRTVDIMGTCVQKSTMFLKMDVNVEKQNFEPVEVRH